jgi:hypothetical protein
MRATEIVLLFVCALTLASVSSYIGGRVHQQRREDDRRRTAFREGFLQASATLVPLVAGGERVAPRSPGPGPGIVQPTAEKGTKRTRAFHSPR